jgi:hypothetical protein
MIPCLTAPAVFFCGCIIPLTSVTIFDYRCCSSLHIQYQERENGIHLALVRFQLSLDRPGRLVPVSLPVNIRHSLQEGVGLQIKAE